MHCIIIRFSAMGDVAMMVPVVYSVARQYPDVRFTVLSRPFARSFFYDLAPNVHFMEADPKKEYHGVKGLNALYRRLVAKQPTHIADLHSVLRSDYLRLRFNLGHYRVEHVDKHRRERRHLVAQPPAKVLAPLPTAIENYVDVFGRLGFPIEKITFTSLFPPEGGNLNLLPCAVGPKRSWEHWVGIAPFAAHRGKVYPPKKMEEVIRLLTDKYPRARVFLFGRGQQEDEWFGRWQQRWPQCMAVSHVLESMYQELILMSHLDVMVSMDSANMHMASLTATPVVSIWGATHPYAGFMGWNQQEANAVQIDSLACRPCSIFGNKPCFRGDWACLEWITPEMVMRKIEGVLLSEK